METEHEPWPLRAAMLAGLGALAGFLFGEALSAPSAWQAAFAAFLAGSGLAFTLSIERLRWQWSAGFALAAGLLPGFVAWWNGPPEAWGAGEGWRLAAALLAVALAVPLFQTARDEGGARLPAAAVHRHGWSDLILLAAGAAFAVATILLALLLAELFDLIGIGVLSRAFEETGLPAALAGAAFGASAGLLRDRGNVLGLLQRVARTILSMLAPVLAAGLVLFVLALPFTGLEILWSKTRAATPILLLCATAALVLANAVAGNEPEEEAASPLLRWPAAALAAVILVLAAVAGLSTWKRIEQHGFTPDRLWACVFILVAVAVGLAYWTALLRGRWPGPLRRANVALAVQAALLAFVLSLPVVDFGAISARDQVARLEAGRVAPDRFDWAALRFDFGPTGREALMELAEKGPAELRARAIEVLAARDRHSIDHAPETAPPPPAPAAEPEPPSH
jgi:hypothetical protein